MTLRDYYASSIGIRSEGQRDDGNWQFHHPATAVTGGFFASRDGVVHRR
jgi:hypothetical protein